MVNFGVILFLLVLFLLLLCYLFGIKSISCEELQEALELDKIVVKDEVKEVIVEKEQIKPYVSSRKKSKGEQACCEAMEKIFSLPFYSVRPNFLKNPETGRNLEIDCYNPQLKIGVEYNGRQHYVYPNFTGMSKQEFLNQLRRDRFKREVCDANGVYLITVPYTVPIEEIEDYIRERLP